MSDLININLIDVVIILCILMAGLAGGKKGAINEIVNVVGIILVYFLSFLLMNPLANIFYKYLPFFNFRGSLDGIVVFNIIFYKILAFLIIAFILFNLYTIILKLSGLLQKLVNATIVLSIPSQIIGFLIGLVQGYIVVFIALTILKIPCANFNMFNESLFADKIIYKSFILTDSLGNTTQAMHDVFDLVETSKKNSKNSINLKSLDIMLKYKVVDKETVNMLVDSNKLTGITNIDTVTDKY